MYDFAALSPYDFELLVADLLSAELGVRLETFAPGSDRGIDARYLKDHENKLVIQCKHWRASGFNQLLAHLKSVEKQNVEALQPDRYIVATSVEMTPAKKDKIFAEFGNFMTGPADVMGAEDINSLLRAHPKIEKSHYKLWLSSTSVLQQVIHSDIHLTTQNTVEEIQEKISIYVQTPAFTEARKILDESHTCIIAGIPGVGKTMLGEMLLYSLIDEGYEPVVLGQDIGEAMKLYVPERNQAFLYDDFLGQTALAEKLGKNEDARLSDFIKRVSKTGNKRFILTTREYILQQAFNHYERLSTEISEDLKFVLTIGSYSRFDRARILYNHLFFSDLGPAEKKGLLENEAYLRVIDHPNYNPRLIEHMVSTTPDDAQQEIVNHFLQSLEHPERLWDHAVMYQLGSVERSLLFVMCSLPPEVRLNELTRAVRGFAANDARYSGFAVKDALRVLEETFVTINSVKSGPTIAFHNPSIRDFLLGRIDEEETLIAQLVSGATYFEQAELLRSYGQISGVGADHTSHYAGIRAWFKDHREETAEMLLGLFESPFGDYRIEKGPGGPRDLVPRGSLTSRLAAVIAAAESAGLDISAWIPIAIDQVHATFRLGGSEREEWVRVLASASNPRDQAAILERAAIMHDWFFEEMYASAEFIAYLEVAEQHDWWLPSDHRAIATALFEDFIPIELQFIEYDVEDAADSYGFLEELEGLADEFGAHIAEGQIHSVQESIQQKPSYDDLPEPDWYGPSSPRSPEPERDIQLLFSTLLDDGS